MTTNSKPQPSTRTPAAWWLATCFGIGWMKPGPGTWASIAALLLWLPVLWFPSQWLPSASQHSALPAFFVTLVLALLSTLIGIPIASRVAREAGLGDPQFVVLDEAAGAWTALLAACWPLAGWPVSWRAALAALVLFRLFDIWKPWPVSALDRIHGGIGIMLDDIAAGLYSLVCVLILRYFSVLR